MDRRVPRTARKGPGNDPRFADVATVAQFDPKVDAAMKEEYMNELHVMRYVIALHVA